MTLPDSFMHLNPKPFFFMYFVALHRTEYKGQLLNTAVCCCQAAIVVMITHAWLRNNWHIPYLQIKSLCLLPLALFLFAILSGFWYIWRKLHVLFLPLLLFMPPWCWKSHSTATAECKTGRLTAQNVHVAVWLRCLWESETQTPQSIGYGMWEMSCTLMCFAWPTASRLMFVCSLIKPRSCAGWVIRSVS